MLRRIAAALAITTLFATVPILRTTRVAASTNPIALGAFVNDTPGNMVFDDSTSDPTSLDRYASLVGRMPAIVMWYQGWGNNHFQTTMAAAVTARNAIPMITWQPAVGAADPSEYSCKAVASGKYDAYMRAWAQAAAAWGHPFLLRFAHEMNGNWYPWGTGPGNSNGNTPADYIAEWRHVHDLFASVGATNALWVWAPGATGGPTTGPLQDDYPGDGYVDYVALDGYNFYVLKPHDPYKSLAQLFGPSYTTLTALTGKPVLIGETSSLEQGGSKAAWITQGFLNDIPTLFPRVVGAIWFDAIKETDWRVNSSSSSLTAFQQVAASPQYQGQLGGTPPPTPSPTATSSPTPTPASSPTSTATPTDIAFSTPTATPSGVPSATATATPTPSPVSTNGVALGAFINDGAHNVEFTGKVTTSDPAAIDRYASMVGRTPAIVMWYQSFLSYLNGFPTQMVNGVVARGSTPMITWMPGSDSSGSAYSCKAVTSGAYDAYIRSYAMAAAAWGHPFLLQFAHEMNGNWYPWSTGPNNANRNTPADFIAEWKHVHDIFTSVGATNALWVWSPNVTNGPTTGPLQDDYPGDGYVDYVALDGYNWYTLQPNTPYRSFAQVFGSSYTTLTAMTGKPVLIGQTSSVENGGSKAHWITQAFLSDIPTLFPRVVGVVWSDSLADTDWRINSSSSALDAYRHIATFPQFQRKLQLVRRPHGKA
ncbi:MAG: glycoside hydrolase family 26 protein [Chloroflexota bacterium]|nr:MAG: hypothetical protein DLM70_11285 [Chloroflexota bacterium]